MFAHLTNCDPYQDMLFAEVDGEVIAFSRVWWQEEGTGHRIFKSLGFIQPAWRRKGIGRAMLRYDERRLRKIAQGCPAEIPRLFEVWASDGETGAHALFAAAGYQTVRYLIQMTRPIDLPLDQVPMPAGLEVRPTRPEAIRAIWDAKQEATQDHWSYVPATEEDYERWLKSPLFNPGLWKVAWDGDQVAGMVLNRINQAENAKYQRQRGDTQDIFVRRPWRRRGLARALLTQSIQMFKEIGMQETALGVDTQNKRCAQTV